MNLARADTYINVYLPREDGSDPRRYAQSNSPVFSGSGVYKFSDQIVKDRKLFIDKKNMSLYDAYYKDCKENRNRACADGNHGNDEDRTLAENDDEVIDERDYNRRLDSYHGTQRSNEILHFPSVNNVRLSPDRLLRRARCTPISRFNEPPTAPGSSKYHRTHTNEDNQVTSFEISRKGGRLVTKGAARTRALAKLFKKAQSAPTTDLRQVRILGLPPITRTNTSVSSDISETINAQLAQGRTLPLRPSSKPNKIWRQTSNVYMSEFSSTSDLTPTVKRLHTGSSRLTVGTTDGSTWF